MKQKTIYEKVKEVNFLNKNILYPMYSIFSEENSIIFSLFEKEEIEFLKRVWMRISVQHYMIFKEIEEELREKKDELKTLSK